MSLPSGAWASIHPGDVVGGAYCLERVLERSPSGMLVSAQHTQFEKRVVIRLIAPESDSRQAARLRREAKLLAKLESDHAARILDVGTHVDGSLYMVREHIVGSTLAERLNVEGPLPIERAVLFALQMCEVVQEVHRLGVVLRELGTRQVIVSDARSGDTRIKLVDLGAARRPDAEMTATLGVGISPYTAPELFRNTAVDGRADVWALGCLLYEMLTARPPFDGEGAHLLNAIARRDPVPVSQIRGDVSESLDRALGWALAKAPADRFASPYAFAHALQPFACTEGRVLVDRIGRIAHARKSLIEETPAPPISVPVVLPPPSTPSRRGSRSSPPPTPQRAAVPPPVSVPLPPEPPPPPPSSRTGPPSARVSWPTPPPVSSPPPASSTSAIVRSISSSSGGWERLPSVPPARGTQFSSMPPQPRARPHTVAVFAAGLAALPTLVLVMMMALAVPTSRSTANGGLADAGVSSAPAVAPRASAAHDLALETPKAKARSAPPAGGQFIKPRGKNASQEEEEEADVEPVEEPEAAEGPGTLVVVVLGGSCALAVDGASRGVRASVTEKVPPGSHSVTCTPKGKTPRSRRVTVEAGKKAVAMFKL